MYRGAAAIMLSGMRKHTRMLLIGASALIALGLTACSGGNEPASTSAPTATNTPFPQSAHYIADVPGTDGKTVTIGVAVTGNDVAAYACDGTSDEAWFFGNHKDGSLDLTGKFQDHLKASFDGSKVIGKLTLNDVDYDFAAAEVPAPAGIYTAAVGDARASWVVRSDRSITGVLSANSKRDREVIDQINAQQADFKAQVRARRIARQLSQAPPLQYGTWQSTINGTPVVAIIVDGNTRF
jgi:hypothetical protein